MQITPPEKVGMSTERLERINASMQQPVDQGLLPGISTLVARKNEIVHCSQYGFQDLENKIPLDANTLFRVYSMTKPVVSTAAMILFERGLFCLQDPVANYIPSFAHMKVLEVTESGQEVLVDAAGPITIEHLLTHTSGLVYGFYTNNAACTYYREAKIFDDVANKSLKSIVDSIAEQPLGFHPGEQFYYGANTDVLGRLIEVISGKSLQQFMADEMFKPLGMENTYFCVPEEQRKHLAQCYGGLDILKHNVDWSLMMETWVKGVNELQEVNSTDPMDEPGFASGGHGLKMTIQDYYTFAKMLLNKGAYEGGQLLSPKTVELMMSNHLEPRQMPVAFQDFILTGLGFGLGGSVMLSPAQAQKLGSEGNFGWSGAAYTTFWIDPKEELIAIFMTQSTNNFSMVQTIFNNLVYQSIIA